MIQIEPSDMHLLVLICTNPHHPMVREILKNLGPEARAVAIEALGLLGVTQDLPAVPVRVRGDAAQMNEVIEAAREFAKLALGRKREHENRIRSARAHAVPA